MISDKSFMEFFEKQYGAKFVRAVVETEDGEKTSIITTESKNSSDTECEKNVTQKPTSE